MMRQMAWGLLVLAAALGAATLYGRISHQWIGRIAAVENKVDRALNQLAALAAQMRELRRSSGEPPRFGHETPGVAWTPFDVFRGSRFTCPEDGEARSIAAYIASESETAFKAKAAIYRHNDSSLAAASGEAHVPPNSEGWVEFEVGGSPEASTEYVLVVWSEVSPPPAVVLASDAGETYQGHYDNDPTTCNGWPDPGNFAHNDRKYSIYCIYQQVGSKSAQDGAGKESDDLPAAIIAQQPKAARR